ncbi:unnamed protein product [Adineta steineri]|uniref:Uncharacterized protein n=1 Tax=Adineta steineri TaxID=433720 RepID=A0A820MQQ1_9BILA|nr:unnamed protein product [Adineta steineri]
MPPSRTIITAERFYNNLEQAAQLSNIVLPEEYFSTGSADYCNEIHTIFVPIILLHLAATIAQQSLI